MAFTRFDSGTWGTDDLTDLQGATIANNVVVNDHRTATNQKIQEITYTGTNRYTVTVVSTAPIDGLTPASGYKVLTLNRKDLAGGKGETEGAAQARVFNRASLRAEPDETLTIDGDSLYSYTFDCLEDAAPE